MNWYLQKDLKPVGPLSDEEIRTRLRAGHLQPWDLLWSEEEKRWQTVVEWRVFAVHDMPAFQLVQQEESGPVWVILQRHKTGDVTLGPLTNREVIQGLQEKRFVSHDFVWKTGLSGWSLLGAREEFSFAIPTAVSYSDFHDSKTEK